MTKRLIGTGSIILMSALSVSQPHLLRKTLSQFRSPAVPIIETHFHNPKPPPEYYPVLERTIDMTTEAIGISRTTQLDDEYHGYQSRTDGLDFRVFLTCKNLAQIPRCIGASARAHGEVVTSNIVPVYLRELSGIEYLLVYSFSAEGGATDLDMNVNGTRYSVKMRLGTGCMIEGTRDTYLVFTLLEPEVRTRMPQLCFEDLCDEEGGRMSIIK